MMVNDSFDTPPPPSPPEHRPIRSFVKRSGRMGSGQAKALAQWGSQWLIPYQTQNLDLDQAFQRSAPCILEIGFGMGDATAHIATQRPHDNFLCCEVHEPGIGALIKYCHEQSLNNIRIIAHDATEVIKHMLKPQSLAGIHVFFPDPWHKVRHHKRRLIQAALVQTLYERLCPNGYLHLATDWQPYAEHMLDVLTHHSNFKNTSNHTHGYADRPAYRPLTKFEKRGLRLGHGVWDLVFVRP